MPLKVTGPKGRTLLARVNPARLAHAITALVRRFKRVTVTAAPAVKKTTALPLFGVDFTAGPSTAALKKAGVHFVCRYLSTAGNPKNLTASEARKLHAAGISIALVFETTGNRALGGATAGKADAKTARAQAAARGVPVKVPIYFAVDFDPTPQQLRNVLAYIRGAASVLTPARTGVYGGRTAVKACLDAKACKYAWQTYAWSGGVWDPRAHIHQYLNGQRLSGATVDFNRAVKQNFGQWAPA